MSNRRNALGRGLGALISTPPPTDVSVGQAQAKGDAGQDRGPREIAVALIDPNPEQPRRVFDADQLQNLAASILRHGVLQPVVVRRAGERFELIVGERRWRASRAAGLATIPAVEADVAPQDRLEIAIVENVQRHDLNPIELAHAYRALAESGATQEEIGRKVSMDRSSVANHLRLLELTRQLQEDVETGRISMGHAKALLQVGNSERRQHLRDRVVAEGLSVRATERLGREIAGPAPRRKTAPPPSEAKPVDADIARLLAALQGRLQARVHLKGDANRGRIEIEYSGGEDLQRVAGLLLGDR